MFSSTFYGNLAPEYRQKLLQLESIFEQTKKWNECKPSDKEKEECFEAIVDFYYQYMMPKELWGKTLALAHNHLIYFFSDKNIIKPSVYQYYYVQQSMGFFVAPERKLYDYKCSGRFQMTLANLCFPHKDLDSKLEEYEKNYSYSIIPTFVLRRHEEMKVLYSKIKAVEEDDEKWIKALMEANDIKFVEHNVEYRLGRDLTNKKLWKMYLEYLKSHDNKRLLQTYSKYCRFFLDDTVMLEEYRNAAGNEKVIVPWKNLFDFEVHEKILFGHDQLLSFARIVYEEPPQCHFTDKNALRQNFPFKENLMHYIITNASAFILQKLHKSCKWCYLKNPVSICYKFDSLAGRLIDGEISQQSILIRHTATTLPTKFQKLFITTHLIISPSLSSSGIISRIYRCTAKYIYLNKLELADGELELLIDHGNVADLQFHWISDTSKKFLVLDDVIKMVPKIRNITMNGLQCTSKTAAMLSEFPFENKLKQIYLKNIQDAFLEPKAFAQFIVKNVCSKGEVVLGFSHFDSTNAFYQNFKEIVCDYMEENWEDEFMPLFLIQ